MRTEDKSGMNRSTAVSAQLPTGSPRSAERAALHDLRNHLHGVVGLMNMLSLGVQTHGDIDTMQVALHSIDMLTQQVDRLTRSYSGEPAEVHERRLCPAKLTRSLGVLFSAFATAHGATISSFVEDRLPLIAVDPVNVSRLLTNLLVNAIKHADATSIAITTSRHDQSRVCISIRDDGHGLALPQRELIGGVLRGEARSNGYTRTGISSCVEMALAAGIELELRSDDGPGVAWDVLVPMWQGVEKEPTPVSHDVCSRLCGQAPDCWAAPTNFNAQRIESTARRTRAR